MRPSGGGGGPVRRQLNKVSGQKGQTKTEGPVKMNLSRRLMNAVVCFLEASGNFGSRARAGNTH